MSDLAQRYLNHLRTIIRSQGFFATIRNGVRALFIDDTELRMRVSHGYFVKNRIERKDNSELLKMARATPRNNLVRDPLISVIIPTYNRAKLLSERAIPSVLRQSYRHFELIIVGDHCTDNTGELVNEFHDRRIKFFNLQKRGDYPKNPGYRWLVAGTVPVNKGLELATGEWIAHLDDDDEFSEDHLEILLKTALEHEYEFVYGIVQMEKKPGEWQNVGSYPPKLSQICRLSIMYDARLKFFRYNPNAWKYFEPADWNSVRRMQEAGVRIGFIDRVVGKHYLERQQ